VGVIGHTNLATDLGYPIRLRLPKTHYFLPHTEQLSIKRLHATIMKREIGNSHPSKKTATNDTILSRFRDGLFDASVLEQYTQSYSASEP